MGRSEEREFEEGYWEAPSN